jgi:hypothetical protein
MTNYYNNGPAFPAIHNGTTLPGHTGLSMRDYFAAKAMQAEYSQISQYNQFEDCAKHAYIMADAMLKERNKKHATK